MKLSHVRVGGGSVSLSLEQIIVHEYCLGQWDWPHDTKPGLMMEVLGSQVSHNGTIFKPELSESRIAFFVRK